MGVEFPPSGSGVFQTTFSVADHFSGRFVSAVTPSPVGPRHDGQFAARTVPDKTTDRATKSAGFIEAGIALHVMTASAARYIFPQPVENGRPNSSAFVTVW
jgi:hypothetical protein